MYGEGEKGSLGIKIIKALNIVLLGEIEVEDEGRVPIIMIHGFKVQRR